MDKIEVSQRAWDAAVRLMADVGLFSNALTTKAAQAFARFERDILAHTAQSMEPVAWMYEQNPTCTMRDKPFIQFNRAHMDPKYWTETPLYAHPPVTDVAALVEAAKAMFSIPGDIDMTSNPPEMQREAVETRRQAWDALRQALAPFTKGQNDELA